MKTVSGQLILTWKEAYLGLCAADRAGDYKTALTLASLLIRGFETGRGVKGFPADKVPVVVEMERKARAEYERNYRSLLQCPDTASISSAAT